MMASARSQNKKRNQESTISVSDILHRLFEPLTPPLPGLIRPQIMPPGESALHLSIFFTAVADIVNINEKGLYQVYPDGRRYEFKPCKIPKPGSKYSKKNWADSGPNGGPRSGPNYIKLGIRWVTAYEDALAWIDSDDDESLSFNVCCEVLQVAPSRMRKWIKALPKKAPKVGAHHHTSLKQIGETVLDPELLAALKIGDEAGSGVVESSNHREQFRSHDDRNQREREFNRWHHKHVNRRDINFRRVGQRVIDSASHRQQSASAG